MDVQTLDYHILEEEKCAWIIRTKLIQICNTIGLRQSYAPVSIQASDMAEPQVAPREKTISQPHSYSPLAENTHLLMIIE